MFRKSKGDLSKGLKSIFETEYINERSWHQCE